MPIYEYRCRDCRRRVQVLTLRVSEEVDAVCEHCGGRKLDRLMSRFAMARSEESRLESLADPSGMGDVDESDPRSVARWMRRMGKELGDEVGGPEFDQMVDELESDGDGGDAGDLGGDADSGGTSDAGGSGDDD
jgi:putative FmdB family regulatory protein